MQNISPDQVQLTFNNHLDQGLPNHSNMHTNHFGILLNKDSICISLEWAQKFCIFNQLPSNADPAALGTTLSSKGQSIFPTLKPYLLQSR